MTTEKIIEIDGEEKEFQLECFTDREKQDLSIISEYDTMQFNNLCKIYPEGWFCTCGCFILCGFNCCGSRFGI